MLNTIRARLIETDPEAAKNHAAVQAAEALLSTIASDERRAVEGAARALGLPKEAALAVGRADPIKEAARKAS